MISATIVNFAIVVSFLKIPESRIAPPKTIEGGAALACLGMPKSCFFQPARYPPAFTAFLPASG
jgi:hypothetical protein